MDVRVLITGGQGFLGRHLAAHWLTADARASVLAIGRSPRMDLHFPHPARWAGRSVPAPVPAALRTALADPRYRYVSLDVRERPALTELLGRYQPTHVVHLAAALRDEPLDRLLQANVVASAALCEAVAGAGIRPERIVFGSSGGVYGRAEPTALPLDEATPVRPLDLYTASKRFAEDVTRILAERYGLAVCWARIFNPIGPGQDERHLTSWLAMQAAAAAAGEAPAEIAVGPLDTTRDFVDVEDVNRALRLVSLRGEAGTVYHVASGTETPVAAVLDEVLRQTGLGDRVRILRREGRPADVPRQVACIDRLRDLGFAPSRDLGDSMRAVLAWYSQEVSQAAQATAPSLRSPGTTLEVVADRRHRYAVEVRQGLLGELPHRLAAGFPGAHLVVLTDETVARLYGADLLAQLHARGLRADAIVLADGERSKEVGAWHDVIARLHELRFDRRGLLVNLGGGLVTDVGGFVAAAYMRGVQYVNVPTTLLAQHDSAIGAKVAVNAPWAKNAIGAFHHPQAVFTDPCLLATLSDRDVAAGVAEAIKVALCGDEPLFSLLEGEVDAIRWRRDPAVLQAVVQRASATKIRLLAADPYEVDLRRVLNLGHTFGHPLETELAYAGILHGEAVGFGIAVATEVARARGVCSSQTAERILALLHAYGLPPRVPRTRLHAACARLDEIRLVRGRTLNFVLPVAADRVEIVPELGAGEIPAALEALAAHALLGACVEDR